MQAAVQEPKAKSAKKAKQTKQKQPAPEEDQLVDAAEDAPQPVATRCARRGPAAAVAAAHHVQPDDDTVTATRKGKKAAAAAETGVDAATGAVEEPARDQVGDDGKEASVPVHAGMLNSFTCLKFTTVVLIAHVA
jgi:hypothetical protein